MSLCSLSLVFLRGRVGMLNLNLMGFWSLILIFLAIWIRTLNPNFIYLWAFRESTQVGAKGRGPTWPLGTSTLNNLTLSLNLNLQSLCFLEPPFINVWLGTLNLNFMGLWTLILTVPGASNTKPPKPNPNPKHNLISLCFRKCIVIAAWLGDVNLTLMDIWSLNPRFLIVWLGRLNLKPIYLRLWEATQGGPTYQFNGFGF